MGDGGAGGGPRAARSHPRARRRHGIRLRRGVGEARHCQVREIGAGNSNYFVLNLIRGLPFSMYAKFSGFLTPSLPLVRISRNLSVLLYAEISKFFNPPPPLSAYVLNGSSLSTHINIFELSI